MSLSGTALDKRLNQAKYLRIFLTCSLIGSLLFHLGVIASGVINLLLQVPEVEEEPVEIVLLDEPIEEVQTPEPIKPKPEVKKIETPPEPKPEPKPEIKEVETPPEPKLEPKLEIPDIPKPVTPLPKQFTQKFTLPEVNEPLQQKPLEPEPVKPVEPIQPKKIQVTPPEPIKPIEPEPIKPIEPIKPLEPIKPIEPIQTEPIQTEQKEWESFLSKKSDITTSDDFSINTPATIPNPEPIPNNNSNTRKRKIIGSSNNSIPSNPNLGNIGNNNSRRRKKIGDSNIASNPINPNPGIGESNGTGDGRAACRRCTKRYPSWARSRGIEGTIVVMVNADAAGNVTNVDIVSGSGNSRLDNYHRKQVRRWKLKSSSNGRNNVRIVTRYQLRS